ncbi:hypothetical protein EVAR_47217_1 [Eumeta japonica]|uniref:Uncharacterized protein n=1 Tax=Eumeta variegata TaxID=151549 RepID=A0A4C1XYH9_EUMVA|nr:hypothetical protein EVAR_47217_1 [Eumeta japonica]
MDRSSLSSLFADAIRRCAWKEQVPNLEISKGSVHPAGVAPSVGGTHCATNHRGSVSPCALLSPTRRARRPTQTRGRKA